MDKEISNSPENNFNALAKTIDERYAYFTLKNIDWDSIVDLYRLKIKEDMSVYEEFKVYDDMLYTLRDGHVNLISDFNVSRYWEWYLGSLPNFNFDVVERYYLGVDYYISGGLKYNILKNKYGYVYYGSFNTDMSKIDFIKSYFNEKGVEGIIIDVRNNGGGSLQNAVSFANQFTDVKKIGYIEVYKTGPDFNNFSSKIDHYIEPEGSTWNKPIIILTNRKCYSATSFFVTMMKELPNVTVLGDNTGGGGGLPVEYTLPNGWLLRFSATRTQNVATIDIESGVPPDEFLDLNLKAVNAGVDNVIERAIKIIDQGGI